MSDDNINSYVPSLLNPRSVRKHNGDISLTQNSFVSRSSLSLIRKNLCRVKNLTKVNNTLNKENSQNVHNLITATNLPRSKKTIDKDSLGFSAIEDIHNGRNLDIGSFGECDIHSIAHDKVQSNSDSLVHDKVHPNCRTGNALVQRDCEIIEDNHPLISVSSNTELDNCFDSKSDSTVIYNLDQNIKPLITVSFGVNECQNLNINSKKSNIKSVQFLQKDGDILVDCEIIESSKISYESEPDENMNEPQTPNSLKRSSVTVNLEVKKKKLSPETADNSRVLILKTSAVEKISHIIVQPPNYKLVKKTVLDRTKIKSIATRKPVSSFNVNNGAICSRSRLRQKSIDSFFCKPSKVLESRSLVESELVKVGVDNNDDKEAMSRKSDIVEKSGQKSQFLGKLSEYAASNRPNQPSPKTTRSTPRCKNDSPCSFSSRHNVDSIQFPIQNNLLTKKLSPGTKPIPHHKIVSGTHFAVDAFSYGKIQNVNYYFLTHFHSDHYCGLKKTFNKVLFCSKITADLCISRLGVNPKCIHVIKIDETVRIDGVEVTAVEANHCPGAIMLVFTLANGKTLLHTGDFRASPAMESYPIFWNKDIHTIYLDTTYCNPRYDFPTQEQSLEMALYILRQKKIALEKVGKKFSSVLIVCGTYTIGKEKFFLGMARRVGCSVWACPEKDRVLQAVEGRSFGLAPPQSCQLHVVPMRDLTHDKLRAYLESLKSAFSEVVAFKPSGWENGKNATIKKDMVTIHGIPYSEHSSFSELIRFVKFLKPKQVVPTVDISGGIKAVQKYFQCPLVCKEETANQSKLTDFFSIQNQLQVPAVT